MSKAITKRRFEFVQVCARFEQEKFREVAIVDKTVKVRFGRIGTTGQAETRTFSDEAAAQRHVEMKAAQKMKKGYAEVA